MKTSELIHSLAVAEHLGFRKAASALGVHESVVSRSVGALEEWLQVSLFERTANGVHVTVAGERFLWRAQTALGELELATADARAAGRGSQGRLRIGIVTPLSPGFLRSLIQRYRDDNPDVDLVLDEGSSRRHLAQVRERRLDITFMIGSRAVADCDSSVLWDEPVYVALARGHRLADQAQVTWADLEGEHFIASHSECGSEVYDHIVRHSAVQAHHPTFEQMPVARDTLLNLVDLGFGLTLVTKASALVVGSPTVFRPLADPVDLVSFSAVWSPGNDNPALRRFISLAHVLAGKARKGTSDWTGHAA